MKNFIYVLLLFCLSSSLISAGYEVEFLIENAPVDIARKICLTQINLSSAIVKDEEGTAKIGDEIGPLEKFKVSISDINNSTQATSETLCELLNQGIEEKKSNKIWQSIKFTIKEDGKLNEDVVLYWSPSKSSLFVTGGSENFVISAFQRDLPKKEKNGNFKCNVKVNFFNKK